MRANYICGLAKQVAQHVEIFIGKHGMAGEFIATNGVANRACGPEIFE